MALESFSSITKISNEELELVLEAGVTPKLVGCWST